MGLWKIPDSKLVSCLESRRLQEDRHVITGCGEHHERPTRSGNGSCTLIASPRLNPTTPQHNSPQQHRPDSHKHQCPPHQSFLNPGLETNGMGDTFALIN